MQNPPASWRKISRVATPIPTTRTKLEAKGLFSVLGIFLTLTVLFSLSVLAFEYITGNADGVWMDVDIRDFTLKVIVAIVLLAAVLYPILYGSETIRSVIVSTLMLGLLLLLLEGVCYLSFTANSTPPPPVQVASQPFVRPDWTDSFVEDEILGVRPRKNWNLRWAPLKNGVLYDSITVSTDENSLRTTPPVGSAIPDQHALFFGCSYTYGDGVSDWETFPYQFQTQLPHYRAYNLAYLAYSPLHMLARLQHEDLTQLTPHKNGFGVFTYINDHIDRAIPATRWISMVKGNFPALNKSTMTTDGVFAHKKRLYSDFIQWFRTTYTHHVFRVDFPKKHTPDHYQLIVDIVKKSKDEYQRQFGNNDFYVIVFPGNSIKPEMKKLFREAGLTVLDYSGLFDLDKYLLPFDDAHPNAKAYELVATQLAKDITSRRDTLVKNQKIATR